MGPEGRWGSADRRLMVDLARRYYLQDASKVDLAREFSISRFQVARLLARAREVGVVNIRIQDPWAGRSPREEALAKALGLAATRIVDVEPSALAAFAAAVLAAVADAVQPGHRVGLSWSRTLEHASGDLPALAPCHLVQLAGALESGTAGSFGRMLLKLEGRDGVSTSPLYAPLVVDEPATARDLRRQPVVADALAQADTLDVAVVAVGAWSPGQSAIWGDVTEPTRVAISAAGAVAEVSGTFLGADGAPVSTPLDGRVLAVTLAQLHQAREVIGFAHGRARASAVRAAAASGVFTSVVVDASLADALLR